jgi:hypothetical protein
MAMQAIAKEGRGLVIYEHQEGRGIGVLAKLRAYELQDLGIDTVEANHALGFEADCRDFNLPVAILRDFGVRRVRLLTNNPRKARALSDAGIEVVDRVPCEAVPTPYSLAYLRTKKEKLGHALNLRQPSSNDLTADPRAIGSLKKQPGTAIDIFRWRGIDQNRARPHWASSPDPAPSDERKAKPYLSFRSEANVRGTRPPVRSRPDAR